MWGKKQERERERKRKGDKKLIEICLKYIFLSYLQLEFEHYFDLILEDFTYVIYIIYF